MLNGDICIKHNCHYCCIETEMLLTKKDIKIIKDQTNFNTKDFIEITKNGHKMLRNRKINNEMYCFFLDRTGLCKIYEIRPEGCQFYPLVWDLDKHEAFIDDYCPYYEKFNFNNKTKNLLSNFILNVYGRL